MNLHLEGPQGSELPWVLYAMSLADVPWNHPGPLNHPLPARQGSTTNLYHHHSPHSSAFCNSGYSHLPSAVYPGNSSFFNMNTLSTEEMERFQKLSNEFEPDIQVGPPQPWTDNAACLTPNQGPFSVNETTKQCYRHGLCECWSYFCRKD